MRISLRLFLLPLALGSALQLHAQATATAARRFDLQAGGGFVTGQSDYVDHVRGGAVYATLDFTRHFGGEFVIHQASSGNGDQVYERTYELGARYFREYGRLKPYIKLMYGRGVFNFPQNTANLAYNIFTGGIGADYAVLPYLNVRADYEYQEWHSFPPNGLNPQLVTIGVAYHFPGNLRRGEHY